jgi:hypothetical protein
MQEVAQRPRRRGGCCAMANVPAVEVALVPRLASSRIGWPDL